MSAPHDPRAQGGSADRPDRRSFLHVPARAALGLGLLPSLLRAEGVSAASGGTGPRVRAKAVIQIFLDGGLSHLDSFDPKPYAPVEVRGEFGSRRSKLDGEPLSELLPRTAGIADRLVLLRGFTHGEAAHERGSHNMLTGYKPSPAVQYPGFGSVFAHELGGQNALPPYVVVPGMGGLAGAYLGPGYLSAAYAPFSTRSDPGGRSFRVRDLAARGVDDARLARRRRLLQGLAGGLSEAGRADPVRALEAFYGQAWDLTGSPKARAAFDLGKEQGKTRDLYGRSGIGARLLLARRLVEAGVRFVVVRDGGWDNHRDLFPAFRRKMPRLDRGFAALIRDLEGRGMLDETLVLLTTEFGRTPRVNDDRGRDHWPKVFSVALAGGGLKRGVVLGSSDPSGREPQDDPTTPADLAATLFALSGIDPSKRLLAPGDRPIDIVRGGRVLQEIVA